ncbi:MAG TPA: Ig-like domain-containing protein [Actinocrinis sp.]|uniref:L,D-transpeptidase n=1 Tax=Actinocrinis sp. TaxID=1920516 RepID=UPI002DDD36B1|nr:Ig-like domain-containing protein [Actinocrinis sp.]HEV3172468.1 Ig-like domain-containing protein [Actinocrinis sp.]
MDSSRKRWMAPVALGAVGVAVAGAGWFGYAESGLGRADAGPSGSAVPVPVPQVRDAAVASASIADGAMNVPPDTALAVTAPPGEQIGAVTLADRTEAVPGILSADLRTWTPVRHLRGGAAYDLTVVTVDGEGGTGLSDETFTTSLPNSPLKIDLISPVDGATVGVGQPVVLAFTKPVADRAAVESALDVQSTPPQPGHWSWLSANRVDYRPQNYWAPGTKVSVRMNLDGLSDGNGHYGTADRDFTFTVGRDQETTIDLRADRAVVRRDGQTVRTFTVSGGMPGLDTWGGTYAVIDKSPDVHMDSRTAGLGDEYDIPDVKWDVHLTYSGTYVHSAPWSVWAQGERNVSHGCVGTSPESAEWFFDNTLPGDIVQVINTPRTVAPGNGFADWQEAWPRWLDGSALG